jgi:putative ATPase
VPSSLRDRHRPGAENYKKYQYPHLDARGYVEQQYLPSGLEQGAFYTPGERGWEAYRTQAVERDRAAAHDKATKAGEKGCAVETGAHEGEENRTDD